MSHDDVINLKNNQFLFQTHVKLFWMIAVSGYIVWSFWPLWGVKIDSRKPVVTPRDEKRKNE